MGVFLGIFFSAPIWAYECSDFVSCPVLKAGDPAPTGQFIADLQKLLKTAGYYHEKINGKYDQVTAQSVKDFQKDFNLSADGVAGVKTWDALADLYEEPVMTNTLKEGPKGKISILVDVNKLQLQVLDDGKVFKTYPIAIGTSKTPSPVGEYKIINKAVNWGTGFGTRWMGLNVPWGIYGIHGTNKPGSIGRAASHGCFRMFNQHVEEIFPWIPIGTRVRVIGYTPKFHSFTRPLKLKSSGQDVVMLQYRLQELGFSSDPADGRYGGMTELAVKIFEAYHMLPVDGTADMEMLKRLEEYQKK
mgnify:CR=1 FL=1